MKITSSCYWKVSTVRAGADGRNVILLKFYENCFILVIFNCLSRTSTVCPEIFLSYFYHILIDDQKISKPPAARKFSVLKDCSKKKFEEKKECRVRIIFGSSMKLEYDKNMIKRFRDIPY